MGEQQEKSLPDDCPWNQENMDTENRRKWHIGKEINLAVIAALIMQTAGVVWWAATTSSRVDYMKEAVVAAQIAQTAIDRRQDTDAERSENRILVQLDKINVKLDTLAERVRR